MAPWSTSTGRYLMTSSGVIVLTGRNAVGGVTGVPLVASLATPANESGVAKGTGLFLLVGARRGGGLAGLGGRLVGHELQAGVLDGLVGLVLDDVARLEAARDRRGGEILLGEPGEALAVGGHGLRSWS